MYPFKQKERKSDLDVQMSEQLCANCPEAPECKKYMQWLRLNPPKSKNNNHLPNLVDPVVFDEPFYRIPAEEIFW